jgi:hypothetical protein
LLLRPDRLALIRFARKRQRSVGCSYHRHTRTSAAAGPPQSFPRDQQSGRRDSRERRGLTGREYGRACPARGGGQTVLHNTRPQGEPSSHRARALRRRSPSGHGQTRIVLARYRELRLRAALGCCSDRA